MRKGNSAICNDLDEPWRRSAEKGKYHIVCPYHGIPLSNKKEWAINKTYHNMSDSQNKYTEQKKPEEKREDILVDSIYTEL